MRILIVYYETFRKQRQTIYEHLYSFQKYSAAECYYLNTYYKVPSFIQNLQFDLIIYHYTITALKWAGANDFYRFLESISILKGLSGVKIAIPQDEYVESLAICRFLKEFGISKIFTCLAEPDWQIVYPTSLSGVSEFYTVLPGYVEPGQLQSVQVKPFETRSIEIGYRARNLPYWLGEHALLKSRIAAEFLQAIKGIPGHYDISVDPKDVLLGSKWHAFLANCKFILGSEGGASLHDPDGSIRQAVENYVRQYPAASFETVKAHCFPHQDHSIQLFSISPRHFESALFQNCQILVEGNYNGILEKDRDYIPVNKNFSNIPEVLAKIKDTDFCKQIIASAHTRLVQSQKYTYQAFVDFVLQTSLPTHQLTAPTASSQKPAQTYQRLIKGPRHYAPISFYKAACLRSIYTWADNTGAIVWYRKLREWR